ncbi:MAG: AMP phosphorylase [Candidatus Aenigmarchaeota archaeon]|nr:AMP phosphorylase [Candidatus Aenigmarchaeota archaeon]
MKFKVKLLGVESGGKPFVTLSKDDSEELGIKSSGRVRIQSDSKILTAIVNVLTKTVPKGIIGVYDEVKSYLNLKEGMIIEVDVAKFPTSLQYIKNKLKGRALTDEEIFEIVKDTVEGNLSEIEIASFVTALNSVGLNLFEAASLATAMVETGKRLQLNKKIVADKHSIGGCVGDKTTMLLVPIIASAGITIPKTSSRAITSAAGTADKAEVLMPIDLDVEEITSVVEKTNGCIAWGGALKLAPADDIFVQIEYPLAIDPLMLPSIMAKKKAVGSTHVVIDIPSGRGTKVKTIGDANLLAKDFIELGKKLGIETRCAITYGEQPIGYCIGPALEAKEALEVLMRVKRLPDLIDKVTDIAGILFGMVGKRGGKQLAMDIWSSGKAESKMREIIMEQGGNHDVKPDDIEIGEFGLDVAADKSGYLLWIDNYKISDLARAAGSPKDKGAGVKLFKKVGDSVKKGDRLFTVYAEKSRKLERVRKFLEEEIVIGVGDRMEMLIEEVREKPLTKRAFILER